MTFLLILLLIIGGFVVIAAALFSLSYAFGLHLYSRECPQTGMTGGDPCAQCNTDRDWYFGLPTWKQSLITGWWLANRLTCNARGCK